MELGSLELPNGLFGLSLRVKQPVIPLNGGAQGPAVVLREQQPSVRTSLRLGYLIEGRGW